MLGKLPPGAQIHQSVMNNPQPCPPQPRRSQSEVPRQKKPTWWAGKGSPANSKKKRGRLQPIIVGHTECSSGAFPFLPLSLAVDCALSLPTVKSRSAFCESSRVGRQRGCGFRSEAFTISPAPVSCVHTRAGLPGSYFRKMADRLACSSALELSVPKRNLRRQAIQ